MFIVSKPEMNFLEGDPTELLEGPPPGSRAKSCWTGTAAIPDKTLDNSNLMIGDSFKLEAPPGTQVT
jgi:hypothetical protein